MAKKSRPKYRDHCKECKLPHKNNEHLFYKKPSGNPRAICKKCHIRLGSERRRNQTPEFKREKYLRERTNSDIRTYHLWLWAQERAKNKKIQFTLTLDYLREIYDGRCSVTDIKFILDNSSGKSHPFSPSLDKIDSTLGYTNNNTRIVCWLYNRAKGADTDSEVLLMAKSLVNNCEEINFV